MASQGLRLLAFVLALMVLPLGCRGDPTTVLTRLEESRKLAADVRLKFSHASDASNRTVMADTEEASLAFARESEQASKGVDSDVAALTILLNSLSYSHEAQILKEFSARFSDYQEVDRQILALAVENTNLKAQALAFGPASQAANDFRDALQPLVPSFSAKDRWRAEALVAEAVLAVREIQVLHSPHIAERDDLAMTRMEGEIAGLDAKARDALKSLEELAPASTSPALADALTALDRFKVVSGQLVQLSRRNSNLRSLDLSLRKKPALTAACDERLVALQAALAKEGPKATR